MDDLALAFEAALVGRSCRVERRKRALAPRPGSDIVNGVGGKETPMKPGAGIG
jgi:hypothetical protein